MLNSRANRFKKEREFLIKWYKGSSLVEATWGRKEDLWQFQRLINEHQRSKAIETSSALLEEYVMGQPITQTRGPVSTQATKLW